ncbi:hypothetical protein FJZ33_00215 [Candidatus Poribacteria bacterium]|nr:hypothetical protein [Candidatus Poribacteria bacterium]
MAWVKTNPANDELLINFPAQCRANWDAIELGTDNALQVTNAKVADSAGIVDTKLAQIVTPSKVSGAALCLLGSIPGGAGLVPVANIPNLSTDKLTSGTLPIVRGGTGSGTQNFVDLTEGQSVGGIKTFTSIPILPASDPTTDNQAARKAYVDINNKTEKTVLVDDDIFVIEDSQASYAKKKVKKSNIIGGTIGNKQLFTSSGIFTAPAGVTNVFLSMAGGGGGGAGSTAGGNAGGGGGGAAWIIRTAYPVTPSGNYTVTVGAAGSGGAKFGNGTAGGNSIFDSSPTTNGGGAANGGTGGTGASGVNGSPTGGSGAPSYGGGRIVTAGINGANGSNGSWGGAGAGNAYGKGGNGAVTTTPATAGTGRGAGGGGGSSATGAEPGAAGSQGFVLVEW